MKKLVVFIELVLLIIVMGFSGCQDKTEINEMKNQIDSEFFGKWQNVDTSLDTETWTFYKNSTVKDVTSREFEGELLISTSWFNYIVNESNLCLSSIDSSSYYSECFNYKFSNNNLTLSFDGIPFIIFTKIS